MPARTSVRSGPRLPLVVTADPHLLDRFSFKTREILKERQYYRMKDAGEFKDTFRAPIVPGHENAGRFWVTEGK